MRRALSVLAAAGVIAGGIVGSAGKRRSRTQHRPIAALAAVVALHAPDGGDDVAVDAVGALGGIEGGAVFGE